MKKEQFKDYANDYDEEEKDQVHNMNPDSTQQDLMHYSNMSPDMLQLKQINSTNINSFTETMNFDLSTDKKVFHHTKSSSFTTESNAKRKWNKLSNVLKGINLMKKNLVKTLSDPEEIVEHINNSPRRRKLTQTSFTSLNLTQQALDDVRLQEKIFDLIAQGGEREIALLKQELENDPKKFIFDNSDPNHIVNRPNRFHQNPLYVACKYGNLEMVKFLINMKANPHILSNTSSKEKESVL